MKKEKTLFDVYRKLASKAFNYPSVKLCSDGDVCTYLKKIPYETKTNSNRTIPDGYGVR